MRRSLLATLAVLGAACRMEPPCSKGDCPPDATTDSDVATDSGETDDTASEADSSDSAAPVDTADTAEPVDTALDLDLDDDGYPTPDDCDDLDPDVNPGAAEVCGDGIDNDCDGLPGGCRWAGANALAAPYIELRGERTADHAGFDVAVGDVDGDGQVDLIVGAPRAYAAELNQGLVYVVHGPITADASLSAADAVLSGTLEQGYAGQAVAVVGDVDGDGADDLLTGQSEAADGEVFLITGNPTGAQDLGTAAAAWTGEGTRDALGHDVASLGDVNGDGVGDFAAGAPDNGGQSSFGGAAYVFLGGTSSGNADAAAARIYGASSFMSVGSVVAGAGDTDGDGLDDLLVGASAEVGFAALFVGPPPEVTDFNSGDAVIAAEHRSDALGADCNTLSAAGDMNGDGLGDIWLGAYGNGDGGYYAGKAYLLLGPVRGSVSLPSAADATVTGTTDNMRVGQGLSPVGDLDRDGYADAVIGAQDCDRDRCTGGVRLLYGPTSGSYADVDADAWFHGVDDGALAGSTAAAADLTGDGVLDLVIGAHYDTGDANKSGSVWIVPGIGY